MNLDESQRKKVAEWVAQGLKLSEIQNRLDSELGLRLTYMEVRFLVDDLKLTPKDVEPPKTAPSPLTAPAAPAATAPRQGAGHQHGPGHGHGHGQAGTPAAKPAEPAAAPGGVSVSVDHLARPGALVSGKVTFSDGNRAEWHLDQAGRLGLIPEKQGYRPPASDVQEFQMALEAELSRMGL